MIILPSDQIERMNLVTEYILKHPTVSVYDIRRKFSLTKDEYEMIFELCMPYIRGGNSSSYWKLKYVTLKNALYDRIRNETVKGPKNKLATDIWNILENTGIGLSSKFKETDGPVDYDDEEVKTENMKGENNYDIG